MMKAIRIDLGRYVDRLSIYRRSHFTNQPSHRRVSFKNVREALYAPNIEEIGEPPIDTEEQYSNRSREGVALVKNLVLFLHH